MMRDGQWGFLVVAALLLGGSQQPAPFPLDAENGIGSLHFGDGSGQIPDFAQRFKKHGRPRMSTQLYKLPHDTLRVAGVVPPADYWMRGGRFIGVDVWLNSTRKQATAMAFLTARYGPSQADSIRKQRFWLGQRTFILLESFGNRGCVMMGSLAMLNELVEENALRAQARQQLGWRPDSIGLPRQMHLRH